MPGVEVIVGLPDQESAGVALSQAEKIFSERIDHYDVFITRGR